MTEPKFTRAQIERNIKQHAMTAGKTIEGIFYKCKNDESYWYSIGVYNVVMTMNNRKFDDLHYFKCTKSGKFEEHELII